MRRRSVQILSYVVVFALGLALGYEGQRVVHNNALNKQIGAVESQISAQPKRADHWASLGVLKAAKSDVAGAEAAYHKALELDSYNVTSYIGMGNIYANQRDFVMAEKWYSDALKAAQARNDPSEIATAFQLRKFAQAQNEGKRR